MTKSNTQVMQSKVSTFHLVRGSISVDARNIWINSFHFLSIVKTAIVETLGPEKCDVVFNLVPKQHAMSDIYCQLIPNEDDNDPYYQVMPRMGAFEVSVNGCVSNQQNYLLRVETRCPFHNSNCGLRNVRHFSIMLLDMTF